MGIRGQNIGDDLTPKRLNSPKQLSSYRRPPRPRPLSRLPRYRRPPRRRLHRPWRRALAAPPPSSAPPLGYICPTVSPVASASSEHRAVLAQSKVHSIRLGTANAPVRRGLVHATH